MDKSLVIVESPSKAKTITSTWVITQVVASVGHIKNLPKSKIGVDFKNLMNRHETIPSKES
jgi:DNA topoisomerase-1